MNRKFSSDQNGFTLLEVMISMVILAMISLGIYQATVETYRIRDVIAAEGEFYNGIRMALEVVARDIASLYSPTLNDWRVGGARRSNRDQNPQENSASGFGAGGGSPDDPEMMELATSDQGRTSFFWLPAIEKRGVRPSRFQGDEKSLSFVSTNHVRIYKESSESIFSGVHFKVESDTADAEIKDSLVLKRIVRTQVFDDQEVLKTDHPASVYPLLRGIKKFNLRYWNGQNASWERNWDNDRPELRNRYPEMIELTFEVQGPENLFFDGVYRFRPEAPLNGLSSTF